MANLKRTARDPEPSVLPADELLDSLDVIAWLADADTLRVRHVNDRAVALLGHSVEEWLAPEFFARHLEPDERALTLAAWREVASDGIERAAAHRLLDSQGKPRWFRTTVRSVGRGGDRARSLAGVMLEVTERIGSQTVLSESEQRFRLFFDQIPAVVYTVDRELRFTSGLGSGLVDLGLRADRTVTGISLYEYFQTRDPDHPIIAAHRRAVAGEPVDYESTWLGRTFQTHVDPFHGSGGEIIGAIGVALDITARKHAEQERDRLLAEEQAARATAERAVRVRDEFLSIASHELFTPVTALQLTLQRLERAESSTTTRRRLTATAQRQVRRLIKLIGDLLNVSRIEAGRLELSPEALDLSALAREVVARFAPELAQSHTPLVLQAGAPVRGFWDRSRLDQVLTNLLSNALKYAAGKRVDLSVERNGETARVRVRDRGIGIAPELLPRIFRRFERGVSARSYAGLGLGLFIVRSIVEAHGGTVQVEDTPGGGATFTVELPLGRH